MAGKRYLKKQKEGRAVLTEIEAKELLGQAGINVWKPDWPPLKNRPWRSVSNSASGSFKDCLGGRSHKTDAGG